MASAPIYQFSANVLAAAQEQLNTIMAQNPRGDSIYFLGQILGVPERVLDDISGGGPVEFFTAVDFWQRHPFFASQVVAPPPVEQPLPPGSVPFGPPLPPFIPGQPGSIDLPGPLSVLEPLLNYMMRVITETFQRIMEGLASVFAAVTTPLQSMMDGVNRVTGQVQDFVGTGFNTLARSLEQVTLGIGESISIAVSSGLNSFILAINNLVRLLETMLEKGIDRIQESIAATVDTIGESVTVGIDTLGQALATALNPLTIGEEAMVSAMRTMIRASQRIAQEGG